MRFVQIYYSKTKALFTKRQGVKKEDLILSYNQLYMIESKKFCSFITIIFYLQKVIQP